MSATYAAPATSSADSTSFLDAVQARRTVYALSKSSPISNDRIVELVNFAVKHCPSSFNSQSTRALVVLGDHHDKVWQIAKDKIKAIVPAENWPASEQRLNGFQNAYGCVVCNPAPRPCARGLLTSSRLDLAAARCSCLKTRRSLRACRTTSRSTPST